MKKKYSFQEIDNEIRDSYLRTSQVFDERDKLRDNWNSLREWLEDKQNLTCGCGITPEYIYAYENALNKMNELEGKDKE